jgi:hypothetical protein
MATRRRPLCSHVSRANSESLAATASRIDHWLLVEYRALWPRQPLSAYGLADDLKAHLREQLGCAAPARLLFVKRPERRRAASIRVYHGSSREGETRFFQRDLDGYEQLLELELGHPGARDEPLAHPLFVICTHGKRDRCCAVYGRPLYDAARDELEDDWVWQASHVGGDRFAGNLLAFPHGLYFGRVEPNDVLSLLAAYRAGRVPLERYRGRCAYTFAEQAAERALREKLSLAGIDDLKLAASSREGDRWRIAFRTRDGARHEQTVVAELGEPAYLTCDAKTPQRPRHFVAVV